MVHVFKDKRDWSVNLILPKDECPYLHYPANYHGCELLDHGEGGMCDGALSSYHAAS